MLKIDLQRKQRQNRFTSMLLVVDMSAAYLDYIDLLGKNVIQI